MRHESQVIPSKDNLKYLGSVIHTEREIDEYATHHIGVRWMSEGWYLESCVTRKCQRYLKVYSKGGS